ncbi:MAG: methylenetetrahydrofolate--tRNA-(uracil(54)-C(5))-methyltransferase (FADH(2)-oxidizing) TrmFO, partial [bacterium]
MQESEGTRRGVDLSRRSIVVIGGGLAGSEAAWQLAQRGFNVRLFEMRPKVSTQAHKTGRLGELVCSNSLKSMDPTSGPGILKAELRRLGSLVLEAAESARIEAGTALTVDRDRFAAEITRRVESHPNIEVVRDEAVSLPDAGPVIVATGPLSSPAIAASLKDLFGLESLYFYDAIAPIVSADSLDMTRLFAASRYDKGEGSFLNAAMNEEEYDAFYTALTSAEVFPLRKFERGQFFQGCLPIEDLAYRGRETLSFGCMRPVGLNDPRTGRRPYAVVQLRPENLEATCYSLVGCQSRLMVPEQRRVFQMIPGLAGAEFLRFGSLHRNTYLECPKLLHPTLQAKSRADLFLAGQITGVEGYLESTAIGLVAAISCARYMTSGDGAAPPRATALGALVGHVTEPKPARFQPMNINIGLFPPLPAGRRARDVRDAMIAERARTSLDAWI